MAENENEVVNADEVVEEQAVAGTEVVEEQVVAETGVVVEEHPAAPVESKKIGVGAKIKEWCRKQIVNLKRKPQNIALFVLFVTSILFLMSLNTFSYVAFKSFNDVAWLGLCIFVSTLFSILVLVLYLNTFPKYPKVNKKTGEKHYINFVMMVLVFLFIAAMIAVDIIFFVILRGRIAGRE